MITSGGRKYINSNVRKSVNAVHINKCSVKLAGCFLTFPTSPCEFQAIMDGFKKPNSYDAVVKFFKLGYSHGKTIFSLFCPKHRVEVPLDNEGIIDIFTDVCNDLPKMSAVRDQVAGINTA